VASDLQKRALNSQLKPGDLHAEDPRWISLIRDARRQMAAAGLGTPAGLEEGGELWLRHYMLAATGLVKWNLHYRERRGGEGCCTLIGYFVTDCLPDERPVHYGARKPVGTHGRTVMVNQKVKGELERAVRVLIDAEGLPVPLPVEVWNAMGLA